MQQQQNKHSSKNYKRNSLPAKLIKVEYIAINKDGELKACFDKENELHNLLETNKELKGYIFKTYSINNKKITTKQKEN